jgi:hypothetical protein
MLQAALLAANGIEAGICQVEVDSRFVTTLMPSYYKSRGETRKKTTVHFFGIAKLDDKWVPSGWGV